MAKTFYITTPIYYVNDRPHIGHASTTVWADVQARYRRLKGEKTFFLTGLDEHGMKVQQAAEKRGVPPQRHCDEMSIYFKELWKELNIACDDFIRTTEPRHKAVVQKVLSALHAKGAVYKKSYQGWYSKSMEQFVTEKEKVDGRFPAHFGEVIELMEENYFFRMSEHQAWLVDMIRQNPEWIQPENRRNEILGMLQKPLEDLCISRPANRLSWGIPLPFDPDYVTYVWFDALLNYITGAGYGEERFSGNWPADLHLIAKDILTPHAVYWPTMLHAMDVPMPRKILAHGWWLMDREKMSKSLGNVVRPSDYIAKYGADALRYFICRELQPATDTDFTGERFLQRFNADLANDLGNLVNRSLSMLQRFRDGKVPAPSVPAACDDDLTATIRETTEAFRREMEGVSYGRALESLWRLVTRANRYVDENAPWKLAKDSAQAGRLDTVMYWLIQAGAQLIRPLYPVMPETGRKIAEQFNAAQLLEDGRASETLELLPPGHAIGKPSPLFPRVELKK
ncbi:MAG: methionine--tRNA ligase [Verrucomicrobiae bacterium]|nr:methionine--tRNA ligase [Verrucomicrobiae bacterium]